MYQFFYIYDFNNSELTNKLFIWLFNKYRYFCGNDISKMYKNA